MKKILGIMGSPRKNGNTHILISKILESAQKEGADTKMIFLSDLIIKECDGCYSCWKGQKCGKNDDMNNIYPLIINSDVLIFGTPVYWFGPTALMKVFIDRLVYFNCPENRAKIKGKNAIIVVPFEDEDIETASPLLQMFEKSLEYLEVKLIERLIVPGVTKKGEVIEKAEIMKTCYALGRKLAI
ncbi:MAG TPA: flavodoxin family protein [Candidatus Lokiarchaeia archaeon]